MRPCGASLQELLGLWRGDERSTGYASEALAFEIALKLRPKEIGDLYRNLYPDDPEGRDLDDDVRVMVNKAFSHYRAEVMREARKAAKEAR